MRKFDYSILKDRTWDNEILSYVSQIQEYKGKQELFTRQKPTELKRLTQIARIQSTESSNRIEGIVTTNPRLKQLMNDKTTPRNRDEEEILGYRNVLSLVHEDYDAIPVRPNCILQMHRDLLRFTNLTYGGSFKTTPNEIDMILGDGKKIVLFKPLEPYETPDAVTHICESYQESLEKEIVHPLILIPCFILDFLCIHPFNDGNGRMSRLLTLLLLYRSGYMVGQYISIEKAIADTKESYYKALADADKLWHEEKNDPKPFIKYMLGVILACYREFEARVTIAEKSGVRSTSYNIVKEFVRNKIGTFTKQEAMIACPSLGSSSVESALKKLVEDGTLKRLGAGRKTHYVRSDAAI
ncbi:Fic family protein [Mageeibacillus indolicus]|uniref:Fic family protein n=2 Tax=Oscillospiraceae TaxID=216572 RepID=D3QZW6_MAGIU|nr:Fic family protein [Mageeibacillus indolicus]ADC90326.1 Fic family protein [Mageeibacillus indolicus UPII9-5]KFA56980.1 cell division protein Fic [Mageeibacillus indolicus 0009-5]